MSDDLPRLRTGMLVRDNDPRMPLRPTMIIDVIDWDIERAVLRNVNRRVAGKTFVALRRIHTDGKARKAGWSVVG